MKSRYNRDFDGRYNNNIPENLLWYYKTDLGNFYMCLTVPNNRSYAQNRDLECSPFEFDRRSENNISKWYQHNAKLNQWLDSSHHLAQIASFRWAWFHFRAHFHVYLLRFLDTFFVDCGIAIHTRFIFINQPFITVISVWCWTNRTFFFIWAALCVERVVFTTQAAFRHTDLINKCETFVDIFFAQFAW